jgi:hypothetical protein
MTAGPGTDSVAGRSRTITIVGGGQAGLMLAIGLRRAGHAVRLVQDRPAAAIAGGRVLSSQCMFATALAEERALGLDLWSGEAPQIDGIRIQALAPPGVPGRGISFTGRLQAPAVSVDQRLKFPAWLDLFERIGGTIEIATADVDLLERCARDSELVVVTAGKGPLSGLFQLNARWSPFTQPMRALAMVYLRGGDAPEGLACVTSTGVPGAGGIMRFPALTHGGPCEILLFEAVIGGPLDIGRPGMTADEQWTAMHSALAQVLPQEAERLASARPTDGQAALAGRITPAVRHAVSRLPSDRRILGLGDAVVLNDPLVGQGANNAARMAALALQAIQRHGSRPFDETWAEDLAAAVWRRVRAATIWTNMNLQPPSSHVMDVLRRATADQVLADRYAQGFDEPSTILPLLLDREAA